MPALLRYLGRHHVGLLALFVAMSGSAYAAGLARNSVGTAQLKRDAVTSAKVKDGSLRAADFARSDLARLRGPVGLPGAAGATGATGAPGVAGRDAALIDTLIAQPRATAPSPADGQSTALTFALPSAGKVDVAASVEATGSCPGISPTACVFQSGLYLDGRPVPNTAPDPISVDPGFGSMDCNGASSFFFDGFGQIVGVPAGTHTVTVAYRQTAGSPAALTLCAPFIEVSGPYQG